MKHTRSERGQVMVFIAIGFIVILGFVGLAIDSGMVYSDRRHAQNAADSAALAGGRAAAIYLENSHVFYSTYKCTDPRVYTALEKALSEAKGLAKDNGYTIDNTIADMNGVQILCSEGEKGATFPDKYIDVTVYISTTTPTTFSSLLFNEGLNSQVEAVTRVRPRMPLAMGYAIVALSTATNCNSTQNGVQVQGNSKKSYVNGGGVFSNGCMGGGGKKLINVVAPQELAVAYAGSYSGGGGFSPAPQKASQKMPDEAIAVPMPNCNDPKAIKHNNKLQIGNGDVVTLAPGLHCFYGSPEAIKMTDGELKGSGVTIRVVGDGSIDTTGGVLTLSAPSTSPDPAPAIPNVLIYSDSGDVKLTGNGYSYFLGTVYAPKGDVELAGGTGVGQTFNTQVIGLNVFLTGGAVLDINFNANDNYSRPSSMDLFK